MVGLMHLQQKHPCQRLRAEHAFLDICGGLGPVRRRDDDKSFTYFKVPRYRSARSVYEADFFAHGPKPWNVV